MRDLPDIYVLRHGETVWNREGRWQGDRDSDLTPQGIEQANAMGRLLVALNVTPQTHRFFASPQGRARRTAELVLGAPGIATEDARLREISVGGWTGMTRDAIRELAGLPDAGSFLDAYAVAPGGEPFAAILERCTAFLGGLDGPAVIVTHGVTSRFLRTAAMGWGLDRIAELPSGQGVIHHIANRRHTELVPD